MYNEMLLLCHPTVNWIQIQIMWYLSSHWLVGNNHAILLHNLLVQTYFMWEIFCRLLKYDADLLWLCVVFQNMMKVCAYMCEGCPTHPLTPPPTPCGTPKSVKIKYVLNESRYFNSVWRFEICGESATYGWVYGLVGGWISELMGGVSWVGAYWS